VGITGGNVTVDFTQRIAILLQIIWSGRFIRSAATTLDIHTAYVLQINCAFGDRSK